MSRFHKITVVTFVVLSALFFFIASAGAQLSAVFFGIAVAALAFFLWGLFTGSKKYAPEDKINQGEDPLGQYFNKYDGL